MTQILVRSNLWWAGRRSRSIRRRLSSAGMQGGGHASNIPLVVCAGKIARQKIRGVRCKGKFGNARSRGQKARWWLSGHKHMPGGSRT